MVRPRSREALKRREPRREPYDRVLIVCEGSKTEPNYLRELIAHHQLSSANVQITGDGGSAPHSVVEYALELFKKDPDYNRVFCVFDRDGHTTFDAAVQRVRDSALVRREGRRKLGAARFEAITSVPCFEYWILLHFQYSTADMPRFADVEPRLRVVPALSNYNKGVQGLYAQTHAHLQDALERADRANRAAHDAATNNPTTKMPDLIRYLLQLAENKVR
ncbi:RloB domain-containing protein [Rhodanobacter denitrificans]|uniref:RloB domain-containing protein n=1 Tax=Rhodanobacter denitrificans TaxID=666685 RepID=UPI0009DBB510